LEREDKGLSDT